jgi:hypothetical protein
MSATLVEPILGLGQDFPEALFVLSHPSSGRYGCYCHEGIHGLASFSTESHAVRFAEWIDLTGMAIVELGFDEAREIAKQRPLPVIALMLLDKMEEPMIHFVR